MSAILPDEVVTLKARLNLEASRHLESIKIIEAIMPDSQRAVLLPGMIALKKDVKDIIEVTIAARDEVARREVEIMVRGEKSNTAGS